MEQNKFHQPGAERASRVEDLFAIVARRYDLINDLQSFGLHRRWKRAMIEMAEIKPGERVLDVCCGTGDVAFGLCRTGAEVTALDFSEAMLAVARARAKSGGAPERRVNFLRGDALQIPFPDGSFDVVTVGYGLRNLADWERGLAEMWRVGRPGARLLVLDFGKPENRAWRGIYFSCLKNLVPVFGKIFCKDAATHAYIFASLQNYPAQRGVAEKMRAMGCGDVRARNLVGGAMSINYGKKPKPVEQPAGQKREKPRNLFLPPYEDARTSAPP
jgi:demethylmenaquinone methyltransferase/2-methoxy-6-polyprenyl-1,4-benzoquinol methylase